MNLKISMTTSNIIGQSKQVLPQTKENFFTIKKGPRRLKCSKIYTQETVSEQTSTLNLNIPQIHLIKKLQDLDFKQLKHSLTETQDTERSMEIKNRQPENNQISFKKFETPQQLSYQRNTYKNNSDLQFNLKKTPWNSRSKFSQNQYISKQSNLVNYNKQKHLNFIQKYQPKRFDLKKNVSAITSLFEEPCKVSIQQDYPQILIEDFQIMKKVGEGTYSKVYMVIHKKSGFICALKVLQKSLIKQLKVEQNAIRQIKILSCLSHPNIATLYGSFVDEKCIYLIMEFCTDGQIGERLKKAKAKITCLPISSEQKKQRVNLEATHLIKQTSLALKYLHELCIIHRDIKPDNILVTLGDNVKLSDFGWAVHNPKESLRKTLCGTPLYLAPQFIINCRYNDSIDIWSLGVMTYQFFTDQFPFKIKSSQDLLKIVKQQINFNKIKCIQAQDFCRRALVQDYKRRADISELIEHKLFKKYVKQQ